MYFRNELQSQSRFQDSIKPIDYDYNYNNNNNKQLEFEYVSNIESIKIVVCNSFLSSMTMIDEMKDLNNNKNIIFKSLKSLEWQSNIDDISDLRCSNSFLISLFSF